MVQEYLWSLVFAMALVSGAVVLRLVRLITVLPISLALEDH
jgi:hypothetical protein